MAIEKKVEKEIKVLYDIVATLSDLNDTQRSVVIRGLNQYCTIKNKKMDEDKNWVRGVMALYFCLESLKSLSEDARNAAIKYLIDRYLPELSPVKNT